jgi:2-methylcitrate dehydratase PrpD
MPSQQLLDFCQFLADRESENTPHTVLHHAKLVLLDTLAVIIRGSLVPEVNEMAQGIGKCEHDTGVTCPGRPGAFAPLAAVMLNGIGGSSLEFEEGNTRAMGHPAIQLVPALMAAAEEEGTSGERLLIGLICGYEGASRISRASAMRKGLHPTGTWGAVGSALGVGCLRRRSAKNLQEIANIASSYAISPFVKNSFVGKNVASTFAGFANQAGYLANFFFERGIRADEGCLQMSFSQFLSDRFDPEVLVSKLGEEYAIVENYFKPYPTCRFTQPSLDALRAILLETKIPADDILGVKVWSFRAAVHTSPRPPENVEAMRFSTPYLVAAMLLHGDIDLEILRKNILVDPALNELAGKVEMILSEEYEGMRPTRNPAKVSIQLKNGQNLTREVIDCMGDPQKPMQEEAIFAKFMSLAGPVIGQAAAQEFMGEVRALESVKNVQTLFSLLRKSV